MVASEGLEYLKNCLSFSGRLLGKSLSPNEGRQVKSLQWEVCKDLRTWEVDVGSSHPSLEPPKPGVLKSKIGCRKSMLQRRKREINLTCFLVLSSLDTAYSHSVSGECGLLLQYTLIQISIFSGNRITNKP